LRLEEWLGWYDQIVSELQLDRGRDAYSAQLLAEMICGRETDPSDLASRLGECKATIVFGAGPSLHNDVNLCGELLTRRDVAVVAADGACTPLLRKGRVPTAVVTDLDGPFHDLKTCSDAGSVMVVHAHGDNIEALRGLVPRLSGKTIGTTQTQPVGCLRNFGGFTDGDRAVLMCEELGSRKLIVAGMDFGTVVGEYSKLSPPEGEILARKIKKLDIGKRILVWLGSHTSTELYDVTSLSPSLTGYQRITPRDIQTMLSD